MAFVVAILIFAIGSGVSLYEGVIKTITPHPVANAYINYIVLGLAAVFEAGAWWVAFKEFQRRRGAQGYWQAIRDSKYPTVITVLFEDTAAMLGLIVAFIGIGLAQILDAPVFDGLASIVIGLILAATAAALSSESKRLLIGESARELIREGIDTIVAGERGILAINEVLTMHMGPDDILLNLSVDFADDLNSAEVEALISDLERRIKAAHPEITRLFIEAQSRAGHMAASNQASGGES